MTSLNKYYPGRRVYLVNDPDNKIVIMIIRKVKKGVLCTCSDGIQRVYKPTSEIEVYPRN